MRRGLVALGLLVAALPAAAATPTPRERYDALERVLLEARRVEIEAEIDVAAPRAMHLAMHLALDEGNRLALAADNGQGDTLSLHADGQGWTLLRGTERKSGDVGAEQNRALILGLLRQGLAHNARRLEEGGGIDGAEGGTASWTKVANIRPLSPRRAAASGPSALALAFDVFVDHRRRATAVLWLDEETELPLRRVQDVYTESGATLTVTKTYRRFLLE